MSKEETKKKQRKLLIFHNEHLQLTQSIGNQKELQNRFQQEFLTLSQQQQKQQQQHK